MKSLLLCSLLLAGCATNKGSEIHIYTDFETGNVTGYVVIDGVTHTLILNPVEK
jgi:hypothetical protein